MPDRDLQIMTDGRRVVAQCPGGATGDAAFALTGLDREVVDVLTGLVADKRVRRRAELAALGGLLARALLPGDAGLVLRGEVDRLGVGERLRIELTFRGDGLGLAALPWEFLHLGGDGGPGRGFLATDERLVLARTLPTRTDRREVDLGDRRIRLLAILSQPPDLGPVLVDQVLETLEELAPALGLDVLPLRQPTIDAVATAVRDHPPDVVHFIGHGRFADGAGELALVADGGTAARWASDEVLGAVFRVRPPAVVVAQACDGARVDLGAAFSGVAPKLAWMGAGAVVAMQYPIENGAAIRFSRAFYGALRDLAPVDVAVQGARREMALDDASGVRDFGIPVLYMAARGGFRFGGGHAAAAGGDG